MRIILYTGYQDPHWNPSLLTSTGLGGTEQCVLNLAKQLATEHEVYVVGEVIEGEFDGVLYITTSNALTRFGTSFVDCVIGVSYIHYLIELRDLNFTHSILWVHNTDFYPWYKGQYLPNKGRDLLKHPKMTGIVCLTDWHKKKFIEQFPEVENKIKVIGNGVDVDRFVEVTDKLPNSFIYTSHAERGLVKVLDNWDDIRKSKPNSELHIATPEYGLEYFNQNFLTRVDSLDSVFFHGTLPLNELYDLMAKCEYWYYPTDYEETFCITALEMLGHRVNPISTETAALKETLSGFNLLTLDNLASDVDWNAATRYVKKCDWSRKKTIWSPYIYDMSTQVLNDPADKTPEIDMLSELESSLQPIDKNESILDIECLYIISLDHNKENLAKWKASVRSNIPWYTGPIVGKKAVNGADVTNSWLSKNDYELYDWQLPESDNGWWNRPLDPGAIGCAISHHQIWKHAHKNNFKNIIILEDDFEFNVEILPEQLTKVPTDFDLFYFGRNPMPEWSPDVPAGPQGIVKPGPSYNTHAYMLSAKGVKSLLDQQFNKYIMPLDEFFICCYATHMRQDLNFICSDLIVYGVIEDLIYQTRFNHSEGPRTDLAHKKHPELYSYWDDPESWKVRFVSYATRTKEWELVVDEHFYNCYSMPLFTQEFCEMIREEAEYSNAWTTDRHENYPTTDMLLEAIGMDRIYYEVLKEFIFPAAMHLYNLTAKGWDTMSTEDFLAKYVPDAQGHLSLHHDASDITALVTLSNFDEYEGGGTYFSHQRKLVKEKQGHVSIHPGNITHRHGARATTSGKRYIIVSFMSQSSSD
jgi:glycosyltransferase involved in cell wall biosynthesis